MMYTYCRVYIEEMNQGYYYIADDGLNVEAGDLVAVPFGKENNYKEGVVMDVVAYDEEYAPYPVELTKNILEILKKEYCLVPEALEDEEDEDQFIEPSRLPSDGVREEDIIDCLQDLIDDKSYAEAYDLINECLDTQGTWSLRFYYVVEEALELAYMEGGMAEAANDLGAMYYLGDVVEQDYEKAKTCYEFAASKGLVRAICNLGYIHAFGRCGEVNYKKAFECFNKAALLNDPNALYKLGDMYLYGDYVEKDEDFGFSLFIRAANTCESDDPNIGSILYRIGRCQLYGIGTDRDAETAMTSLLIALQHLYIEVRTDRMVYGKIEKCRKLIDECHNILEKRFNSRSSIWID